jgi:hypothetical protein
MNAAPIMSAADNTALLSLAAAQSAIARPAPSSGTGLLMEAKQLDQARASLRDGETFSAIA